MHRRGPPGTHTKLRHHLGMVHNRTGNELREIRYKQAIVDEAVFLGGPGAGVAEVCDLLKREERDGQWQYNRRHGHRLRQQAVGLLDREMGILEIAQQPKVHRDPGRQPRRAPPLPPAETPPHRHPHRKVEPNGDQQQRQIGRIPPGIENHRGRRQPSHRRATDPKPVRDIRPPQDARQKHENEDVGIEQHAGSLDHGFLDDASPIHGAIHPRRKPCREPCREPCRIVSDLSLRNRDKK